MLTFETKRDQRVFPVDIQDEINQKVREYAKNLYNEHGMSASNLFTGRYNIYNYRANLEDAYWENMQAPGPPSPTNFYPYHSLLNNGWNYI